MGVPTLELPLQSAGTAGAHSRVFFEDACLGKDSTGSYTLHEAAGVVGECCYILQPEKCIYVLRVLKVLLSHQISTSTFMYIQ